MLALVFWSEPAAASVPTEPPLPVEGIDDGTGATVRASTSLGDRLYLGGGFDQAGGRAHTNLVAIDMTTRTVDHDWTARTNAIVHAMVAAPDGSAVIIGGSFTSVNGVARRGVARLHPVTGQLLADQIDVNGDVLAMAVHGDRLYLGGEFSVVDGRPRRRLVALENGAVVWYWIANANGRVRDLKLTGNGQVLYVAGSFTTLDGAPAMSRVARVRSRDGQRMPFDLDFPNSWTVIDLALSTDETTLYMAVGGPPGLGGNRTRAVRVSDRRLLWAYDHESDPQALLEHEGVLYIGGHFDFADAGDGRTRLMALDARTGGSVIWLPRPNSAFGVWDLDPSPWGLIAVGDFSRIDGVARGHVAIYQQVGFADPPTPRPECQASIHPSGRVVLRWNPWMAEDTYIVRRDGDFLARVEGGGLAHSDRGPSPGPHHYVVRVKEIGVVTDIGCGTVWVPEPPVSCRVIVKANGRVDLRWDEWPGEDTYIVRRDGGFATKVRGGGLNHLDDPGVGSYAYVVRIKENGIQRDVACGPVTVAPADFCAATATGPGVVALDWDRWPGEDTYIVRRDGDFVAKTFDPKTAYTDTGVASGKRSYLVRMKAAGVVTNVSCGRVTVP